MSSKSLWIGLCSLLALIPILLAVRTACAIENQGHPLGAASMKERSINIAPSPAPASTAMRSASYERVPLSFEPNQGQADRRVKFLARGNGYTIYLTPTQALLTLSKAQALLTSPAAAEEKAAQLPEAVKPPTVKRAAIAMRFEGANRAPAIESSYRLPGISNYMIGNDRSKWRTNIPNFAKVRYRGIYPGIDVVYYGVQGRLEYDLVLAAGANPDAIRLKFAGARQIELNQSGQIVLNVDGGQIVLQKPLVYQEIKGGRTELTGKFKLLKGSRVGFELAEYDRTKPVVIDPAVVYSSYLGGTVAIGRGGLAVDSSGSAYLAGWTCCVNDFPEVNPISGSAGTLHANANNVFVSKFSPDGSQLLYSTIIAGSVYDFGFRIAVDTSGDAYVTGYTASPDYPTTANTIVPNGRTLQNSGGNVFVTELNPSGNGFVYSTLVGGTVFDLAQGIATDSQGNTYVVGQTSSTNFPTTANAYQQNNPNGGNTVTAFLTKLHFDGTNVSLAYSSYVGSSNTGTNFPPFTNFNSVAVDAHGDAYVIGNANAGFPVTSTTQPTGQPFGGTFDAFVARIDTTLSGTNSLLYARYLGGSARDDGLGIAIVPGCVQDCTAYVTGVTNSPDFPVDTGNTTFVPSSRGYVAELDKSGTLVHATFVGGQGFNQGIRIAVDPVSRVYVAGTTSFSFPTTADAPQNSFQAPAGALLKSQAGSPGVFNFLNFPGGSPAFAIAVDNRVNPSVIYAGTNKTGLWKSTDGGNTFSQPDTTQFGTLPIPSLTFSNTTGILYLGASPGAVFKSTDGGMSFTQLTGAGAPNGITIWKIIPLGTNDTNLFACTSNGFFKSSDGGATFAQATGLPANTEVFAGVTDGTNFYIGTDRGVYTSTNFGASFISTLLNWQTVLSMAIDTSTSPPTVYAGALSSGVIHSTDGFLTNQAFATVMPSLFPSPWTMAVDPQGGSNPAPLYIAPVNGVHSLAQVLESTDGGVTFKWLNQTFAGALLGMVADTSTNPTTMYAGVFSETDATIAVLSSDLSTAIFETYLGGSGQEVPWEIALDSSGNFYVGGNTLSPDFPTTAGSYEPCSAQPGVQTCGPIAGNETFVTKYSNTFAGSNVVVTPSPATTVTFGNSSGGSTTVTTSSTPPAPAPGEFKFGPTPTFYDITTTATTSGPITVCIDYNPADYSNPSTLVLFHYNTTSNMWEATSNQTNDTTHGVLCGQTTSLSPFGVVQPPLAATIEIKPPSSAPATINISSAGLTPVAVLSSATFNATRLNPATISLDGAMVKLHGKSGYSCSSQDVNGDGLPDLVCQVPTDQLTLTPGSDTAVLTAQTFSSQFVSGQEAVTVLNK